MIRLATAIWTHKFSSKKALCSLSSSKIIDLYKESSFSTVCRRATASGVSRREPPRHGVYGKKKHQKRPSETLVREKSLSRVGRGWVAGGSRVQVGPGRGDADEKSKEKLRPAPLPQPSHAQADVPPHMRIRVRGRIYRCLVVVF